MLTDLLKTAVKVGLKSAAPVLGTLGSELAGTAASRLIDQASDAASKGLEERIFEDIETDLAGVPSPEFDMQDISEVVGVTARSILGSADASFDNWASKNFDPEAAAATALRHNEHLLRDLGDRERALCRLFVEAFFRSLSKQKEAIEKTELRFRQRLLNNLDALNRHNASLSSDLQDRLGELIAVASIRIPVQLWTPEYSPPGALLRADIDDPVPFHGRDDEIGAFGTWCDDDRALAIQVMTGPGGIGKTRFMIEMCKRQTAKGWRAGFLDSRLSPDIPGSWSALLACDRPMIIVVDYAETRRDQVTEFIARLLPAGRTEKTRIVLLARSADDWWKELKRQPDGVGDLLTGPATQTRRLKPLAFSKADREESYLIAASHFSRMLDKTTSPAPPEDLDHSLYDRTLILQMAALAEVEGVVVKGDQGVLNYVLQRERRFWANHASSRELPSYLEAGVAQYMAAITLFGGVPSETDALDLASKIPLLADQTKAIQKTVSDLLHEIYPGERWIEPVLPDLLGEHLCQTELDHAGDELFDLVFGTAEPALA